MVEIESLASRSRVGPPLHQTGVTFHNATTPRIHQRQASLSFFFDIPARPFPHSFGNTDTISTTAKQHDHHIHRHILELPAICRPRPPTQTATAMADHPSAITTLLTSLLPPELARLVQTQILSPSSPVQTIKTHVLALSRQALDILTPLVTPLLDRALATDGLPGFVTMVCALGVLFLLVTWVHRMVMWWTRLAMRAVFWGVVVLLGAWAWQRGPVETARDVFVVGGKLAGFVMAMKDVWMDEYQKYDEQQRGRRSR